MGRWCVGLGTLALVLCLLTRTVTAGRMECPNFDCPLGSHYNGKFISRNNPWSEASGESDGELRLYYFDAFDFPEAFPDIASHPGLDGQLKNAQLACALACQRMYNGWARENGATLAGYWMFENTCDDIGGQCSCMASDVCAPNTQWWSDEYITGWVYGDYFSLPATYTTGKLCDEKIIGDPHFTGADGSHFDFSGLPNETFAIISDAHLQVNGYFGGRWGRWDDRTKALTWIRQVSIMWGHHTAVLTARPGADPAYNYGYMKSIVVDGELIQVNPHGSASAADGEITISWSKVKVKSGKDWIDEYKVSIGENLALALVLRPEVKNLRTKEDAVIHFGINVDSAHLSSEVHGILGQTFRPDFAGRLNGVKLEWNKQLRQDMVPGDNAEGFIDGVVEDYMVKDLDKADCRFCRFARGEFVDDETAGAIAMASIDSSFSSRKLLETGR